MFEHPLAKMRSAVATQFTEALTHPLGKEDEELSMTGAVSNKGLITGVTIWSTDDLDWRVWFWGTSGYDHISDPATDACMGYVNMPTTGLTFGGSDTLYRFYSGTIAIPYRNEETTGGKTYKIYLSVQNIDAAADKDTYANGDKLVVEVSYKPGK